MHARRWNRKGIETILASLLLVVIVVAMTVMVYSWSLGIFGAALPSPTGGKEILSFENQRYNNATSVTLFLRNTGTAPITLVSYYVEDLSGNECAKLTGWSNGPYAPTTLAQPSLSIPASPSTTCSWTGSPFTFQNGNVYTITLVTAHNSQFSFTIEK